jgi:hypothetical protein
MMNMLMFDYPMDEKLLSLHGTLLPLVLLKFNHPYNNLIQLCNSLMILVNLKINLENQRKKKKFLQSHLNLQLYTIDQYEIEDPLHTSEIILPISEG